MDSTINRIAKSKQTKLMLVPQEIEDSINELKTEMETSAIDVISSALKLLKLSLSREVVIKDTKTNAEINLKIFKDLNPLVNLSDKKDE